MQGLYRLAKKVVQIVPEDKQLSDGELVALFRKRLQPIASEATKLKTPQLSILLANEALWGAVYMAGFPLAIIPLCGVPLFHALYWVA